MKEGIYRCPVLDDEVGLFERAINKYGQYDISDFHKKSKPMADVSMMMSEFNDKSFSTLPFCHTVEAEAFGAEVNFGDGKNFPRIKNHVFTSLDEIIDLDDIDFSKGRIAEVLDAISIIKKEGRKVILEISGPLNILDSLIDSILVYKKLNKFDKDRYNELNLVFEKMSKNILAYISRAVSLGVDVISFSDSTGSIEFLGRSMTRNYYDVFLIDFLKKVEHIVRGRCIFHLCPKLSFSMKALGYVNFISIENTKEFEDASYHDFLMSLDKDRVVFLGDRCINQNNKAGKAHFLEIIY